jgi:hypothetical protein
MNAQWIWPKGIVLEKNSQSVMIQQKMIPNLREMIEKVSWLME